GGGTDRPRRSGCGRTGTGGGLAGACGARGSRPGAVRGWSAGAGWHWARAAVTCGAAWRRGCTAGPGTGILAAVAACVTAPGPGCAGRRRVEAGTLVGGDPGLAVAEATWGAAGRDGGLIERCSGGPAAGRGPVANGSAYPLAKSIRDLCRSAPRESSAQR